MRRFTSGIVGVFIVAAVFGSVTDAFSQEIETDPDLLQVKPRVERFFETLSLETTTNAQGAFAELLQGSFLSQQKEALAELVAKANKLQGTYGTYRKFEAVQSKRVGADLIMLRYLYKCERFPVIWTFWFYRVPNDSTLEPTASAWRVIALRFDNDLRVLEKSP